MALRLIIGAAASSLAMMAWGFLFWVVLSSPGSAVRSVPDEAGLLELLKAALPESGTYVFPLPPTPTPGEDHLPALEEFRGRHVAGPVGMLSFSRSGSDPLSPRTYLLGFAQGFGAAFIAGLLMAAVMPVLGTYVGRAAFVFGLGVFAAVAVRLYDPVWWYLPWGHAVHGAFYVAGTWLVGGIVLAGVVKPTRGVRHLTDASKPLWKRALEVD